MGRCKITRKSAARKRPHKFAIGQEVETWMRGNFPMYTNSFHPARIVEHRGHDKNTGEPIYWVYNWAWNPDCKNSYDECPEYEIFKPRQAEPEINYCAGDTVQVRDIRSKKLDGGAVGLVWWEGTVCFRRGSQYLVKFKQQNDESGPQDRWKLFDPKDMRRPAP